MGNFVKLTTRKSDGNYFSIWVHADSIDQLSQDSATQASNNEGTCLFVDEEVMELVAFNQTIDSLS